MKFMGIDYGRRRIGLAVTDETATCVRSLATIDTRGGGGPVHGIRAVIDAERPRALVVGLPLGAGEKETAMSAEVRAFARRLRAATGLTVHFVEESFSSRRAHRLMQTRKRRSRRDKAAVDRVAACLILDQFLREYSEME